MILASLTCTFFLVTRVGNAVTDGTVPEIKTFHVVLMLCGLALPAICARLAIMLGARSLQARM